MRRTGGCACGAVRFHVDVDPLGTGACHCSNCRKFSGGGPNYVVLFPLDVIIVERGEPKQFEDRGDSGGKVLRTFCAECGTPLWSVAESLPFAPVKVGAFDDVSGLGPAMHIYVASAPDWQTIPAELPCFPHMPPD